MKCFLLLGGEFEIEWRTRNKRTKQMSKGGNRKHTYLREGGNGCSSLAADMRGKYEIGRTDVCEEDKSLLEHEGEQSGEGNQGNSDATASDSVGVGGTSGVTSLSAGHDGGQNGDQDGRDGSTEGILGLEQLIVVVVQAEVDSAGGAGSEHLTNGKGNQESLVAGARLIEAIVLGERHLGASSELNEVLEHEEGNVAGLGITTAEAVGVNEELGLLDEADGTAELDLRGATEGEEGVEAKLELSRALEGDGASALEDAGAVVGLEGVLVASNDGSVAGIDVVEAASNAVTAGNDALVEGEANSGSSEGGNQGSDEGKTADDIEAVGLNGEDSREGNSHDDGELKTAGASAAWGNGLLGGCSGCGAGCGCSCGRSCGSCSSWGGSCRGGSRGGGCWGGGRRRGRGGSRGRGCGRRGRGRGGASRRGCRASWGGGGCGWGCGRGCGRGRCGCRGCRRRCWRRGGCRWSCRSCSRRCGSCCRRCGCGCLSSLGHGGGSLGHNGHGCLLSRGCGSAGRGNASGAVILAAAAASGELEQDLGEASDRKRSESNQRAGVDSSNDVADDRELRLGAQVHGIRVAEQNGNNTIVITKSGVGLGAVQLIVTEGDDRAWGKGATETQASILLEDILLNSHDVRNAVSSHLEGGTLHDDRAAGTNDTALVG